jgi:hypothetical protein
VFVPPFLDQTSNTNILIHIVYHGLCTETEMIEGGIHWLSMLVFWVVTPRGLVGMRRNMLPPSSDN